MMTTMMTMMVSALAHFISDGFEYAQRKADLSRM